MSSNVHRLANAAVQVLRQASFFSGLSNEQLRRVAALGESRTFSPDTRIYVVGDPADRFFVLTDGNVRFTLGVDKRDTSGGEIMRSGDVFGWAALVPGHTRRIATAHCLTRCEAIAIDGAALTALMDADPSLGYPLMKALAALLTSELVAFAAG